MATTLFETRMIDKDLEAAAKFNLAQHHRTEMKKKLFEESIEYVTACRPVLLVFEEDMDPVGPFDNSYLLKSELTIIPLEPGDKSWT